MDAVIKPLYEGKNQRFELKTTLLEGRVPVMDKLRVNQVIFNLLSNAVKYTPEGGLISYTVVFTPRADSEDMSMPFPCCWRNDRRDTRSPNKKPSCKGGLSRFHHE